MTMTTKELLALVDSLQESITDWGDNMRNEAMVDLLDHAHRIRAALPALCAEVEALKADKARLDWLAEHPSALVAGGPNIRAAIDAARSRNEHEG